MRTINRLRQFTAIAGLIVTSGSYAVVVMEEIVVVSDKREVNLQDAPIAISAFSSDAMDSQNITNPVDLSNSVPGLQIAKNEGFRRVVAIRGLGLEAAQNDIANPSVSFHTDGVYIASDISLNTDFLDVERVEVMRGPQGTVFGQNSIGGTINVITKAPNPEETEGQIDLALGNYGLTTLRGSLNMPVTDNSALRLSAIGTEHDGYSYNVTTGRDLDDIESFGIKGQYLVNFTDNLSLTLRGEYFDSESGGSAQKSLIDNTPGARNLAHDFVESFDYESKIFSWTLGWDGDVAAVKYIGSYQDTESNIVNDNDRTAAPLDIVPLFLKELNAATHEINIVSTSDTNLDWIVGAFFLDFDHRSNFLEFGDFNVDGMIDQTIDMVDPFSNPDLGFQTDTTSNRESWSVFGQATYHVSDNFRVTAGLRKTEDTVTADVNNFFGANGVTPLRQDADAVTGKVGAEWDTAENNMLYLTYSEGFKPGGTNLTFNNILVQPTYGDETVKALELGSKNRFLDDRLQLNLSAFIYDYEGLQFAATEAKVFTGGVSNLDESAVKGFEAELAALLSERWTFSSNLSFLSTEIESNTLALDQVEAQRVTNELLAQGLNFFGPEVEAARGTQIASVQGNDLPKAPESTANILLTYAHPFDNGELSTTVRYSYRDQFSYRVFANATTDILPSYDIWNIHMMWQPTDADWSLELIATNLTDEDAVNSRATDAFGVTSTADELLAPRLYMLRAGYSF